ncbi:hypothetical protein [Chryseobacterium sp. Leaf394]|uniref:hypothetical protein n=1 Tax=Chryseobacterium sp. Leaf394 TaxID=1736361 RepID=UPI0006FE5296|nr:hypothetical protein [Chryseobacterium sp. Leaf394]KQS91722.1 hypothetical protein ASG21_04470 [Chryseobacterium sp. Leaf394]
MSKFLNVFRYYTNKVREFQLENDLSKALAITLMENSMFLYGSLKEILDKNDFEKLLNQDLASTSLDISIQRDTRELKNYDKIYAVSVSEEILNTVDFYKLNLGVINKEITDIVIQINALEETNNQRIAIIFEVKRNRQGVLQQLFDQALSMVSNDSIDFNFQNFRDEEFSKMIIAKDWNWKKIMSTAWSVYNFQKFTDSDTKILSDFIEFVRSHNPLWMPQFCLNITSADSHSKIMERIEDCITASFPPEEILPYKGRLGIKMNMINWCNELIIYNNLKNSIPSIQFAVYPGNTKSQGNSIFKTTDIPKLKQHLIIRSTKYNVAHRFHIKFSAFSSYFSSIDFIQRDLFEGIDIYTKVNFNKFSGRKTRNDNNWKEIEDFFDLNFRPDFDWRSKCNWQEKMINSRRTRFDVSFGYSCIITIPYSILQTIDVDTNNLLNLGGLVEDVRQEFYHIFN